MVTENKENLCTGCGICSVVCPKQCLTVQMNKDGFYQAVCDIENCVQCGLCDQVCPKFLEIQSQNPYKILSIVSGDEDVLRTTSSGGLCYEIANKALSDGKKVCACVYNYELHRAEHIVVSDFSDLEATKGSKYFQSYTPDAFSQLFNGDEWVVFGTPCQIAALDAAARMKKMRNNFVLVDFFCHGTPSMNLWKKYILEQGGTKIKKIDFRSKEFGWHTFSLRFVHKDNTIHVDYEENMFYRLFFSNLCLGEACYSCKFKAFNSVADIRVGDFWGKKYQKDQKGVSCCAVFSEKGERTIEALASVCSMQDESAEEVLAAQMVRSPQYPKPRKRILRKLCGKCSLKCLYNVDLFCYRARLKLKSVLRRLK